MKAIIIGCLTLLGAFLGYYIGAFVACEVLKMGQLCGLVGVLITGPLGLVAGAIGGSLVARRSSSKNAVVLVVCCTLVGILLIFLHSFVWVQ